MLSRLLCLNITLLFLLFSKHALPIIIFTVGEGRGLDNARPTDINKELVAGMGSDVVCFILLIFQKRLFSSHYFVRIVDEAKAMAVLAAR